MKKSLIIFLTLLLLPNIRTLAEEETPAVSSEITKDMLILCPGLTNAVGKKKIQLVGLCSLDTGKAHDETQKQKVVQLFNLSDQSDSAVLEELLSGDDNAEIQPRLRTVFTALGSKSVDWLLSRYANATPATKGRVIDKLQDLEFKEVYEFLATGLNDKTEVPNRKAKAIAPSGYIDERICDHAFSKLVWKLKKSGAVLPETVKSSAIGPLDSIPKRDQRINALQSYLSGSGNKEWSQLLLKKPSATSKTK